MTWHPTASHGQSLGGLVCSSSLADSGALHDGKGIKTPRLAHRSTRIKTLHPPAAGAVLTPSQHPDRDSTHQTLVGARPPPQQGATARSG